MYYFQKQDEEIIKYEIIYDKTLLSKYYNELIEKCSRISNHEITTEDFNYIPMDDNTIVRNKKCELIDSKSFLGRKKDIYKVRYQEYHKPRLCNIIELILKDDLNGINQLYNYIPSTINDYYNIEIEKLSYKINMISNIEYERKMSSLEEMKKLVEEAKLNENRKEEKTYIPLIKDAVSFKEVDRIDVSTYERIMLFLEKDTKLYSMDNVNVKKLNITK